MPAPTHLSQRSAIPRDVSHIANKDDTLAAKWQDRRHAEARTQHKAAVGNMTDAGGKAVQAASNNSMADTHGIVASKSHAGGDFDERKNKETAAIEAGLAMNDTEGETTYEEDAPEQLLPPLGFQPFFALVEDVETGEHYHPAVQYVFTDDDPEDLTAGMLHAIEQQTGQTEVEDRIIILDMLPDGKTVQTASSLSPHWQSLQTTVSQAPSWGGTSHDDQGKLMIRVAGQEVPPVPSKQTKRQVGLIEQLMAKFDKQLQTLDDLLEREHDATVQPVDQQNPVLQATDDA